MSNTAQQNKRAIAVFLILAERKEMREVGLAANDVIPLYNVANGLTISLDFGGRMHEEYTGQ